MSDEQLKPAGKVVTMYTIQDDKMEVHGYLHLCDTDAQAVRQFGDVINDNTSVFSKHPEDYRLFRVGTFNTLTGVVCPVAPVRIIVGSDLVTK